jgi:hypothetical protein
VVHEAAVADQSPALAALMRGKMSESLAGEVKWEDVDRGTFVRFTQFAYTGDYSIPQTVVKASKQFLPQEDIVTEAIPIESESTPEADWVFGVPSKKYNKPKGIFGSAPAPPTGALKAFNSLSYPLLKPRTNFAETCEPAIKVGSSENVREILLAHASLYVLAEKWGVESLKMLALFKLHRTLQMLRLDAPKVEDIVELTRYTYSDEMTPDLETGINGLRELICHYIAANAKMMAKYASFTALIEDGGALTRDLWKLKALFL